MPISSAVLSSVSSEPTSFITLSVCAFVEKARAHHVAELVFDVLGLQRVFRAAAAVQYLALQDAPVARLHRHARGVPERRAHGLDLGIDVRGMRLMKSSIFGSRSRSSRYCSTNAMPSSAITASP